MADSGGLLGQETARRAAPIPEPLCARRTFVVFADDWGRHPSSCQHLFRRIAPDNRVVWVNTIGTRTPTLSRSDLARAAGKLREWALPAPRDVASAPATPVEVLRPVMIPFETLPGLRAWNAGSVRRSVATALAAGPARTSPPILVTTIPNAAAVVGTLGEGLSVYYCVDEFSEWPGADRAALQALEAELLGKVDLVLATSETLYESKSALHPRVRRLRHGVDWSRFHAGEGDVPAALRALPRPVFGFVGLVDARLDVPLLASLARAFPEASFAFVGPRQLPPGDLDSIGNVHFLPSVPYEDVPAVLHAFDVALLPYVVNDLTRRINPLKLRELLASGVPIVATALPEVLRFGAVLRAPETADAWPGELRAAGQEGRTRAKERSHTVRGESWEVRAAEFWKHCREAEAARGGASS